MIEYKSKEEIELIRNSSLLVAKTLAEVAKNIRPGITTKYLDNIAETFILDHNATPGFKGYKGFPATLCTSPNEVIVHGIPSERELKDGEIVSIDCGVLLNGYYGDSAFTFPIGEISDELRRLLKITYQSLFIGLELAHEGNTLGDVSFAIQNHAENAGYTVVRELVGHGLGRSLHQPPEVPNYGKKGKGLKLKEGLVIAVEPMINMGQRNIVQEKDGWTIRTADRKPSAHYEHTVTVGKEQVDILSTFEYIEDELRNNKNNTFIKM